MKQSFLMVLCVFLLAACSAYNRMDSHKKNGLKTMRLDQSLQGSLFNAENDKTKPSTIKINAVYLYNEMPEARPVVTLDLKQGNEFLDFTDSLLSITLDGEAIPLSSLKGKYSIPENLWVSIVHSQNIQYKLQGNTKLVVIGLNEKQKNKLIAFFHMAIKLRDDLFPVLPEGRKKW